MYYKILILFMLALVIGYAISILSAEDRLFLDPIHKYRFSKTIWIKPDSRELIPTSNGDILALESPSFPVQLDKNTVSLQVDIAATSPGTIVEFIGQTKGAFPIALPEDRSSCVAFIFIRNAGDAEIQLNLLVDDKIQSGYSKIYKTFRSRYE